MDAYLDVWAGEPVDPSSSGCATTPARITTFGPTTVDGDDPAAALR